MRIMAYCPNFPHLGGGDKYLFHFLEVFESVNGTKIDIVVDNSSFAFRNIGEIPSIGEANGRFGTKLTAARIVHLPTKFPVYSKINLLKNMITVWRLSRRYDLFIHNNAMSKQIGGAKKNLYICHFPPFRFELPDLDFRALFLKPIFRSALYRGLDHMFGHGYRNFIFNSRYGLWWFNKNWKNRFVDRSQVLYPPAILTQEIVALQKKTPRVRSAIMVSRLTPDKKVLEAMQVFLNNRERLKISRLVIVGSVSTEAESSRYGEEIVRLALDNSDTICLETALDRAGVWRVLSDSMVFWHFKGYGVDESEEPWNAEHFGMTTVEAMAAGTVPVVINKGGQPEIVTDSVNGFLWSDTETLIQKTNELIENPELWERLSGAAWKDAQRFTVEAFQRKARQILRETGILEE